MWLELIAILKRVVVQATTHPDLGTERAGQRSCGEREARADAGQQKIQGSCRACAQ